MLLTLAAAEGLLRLLGYGAIYEVYSQPSILWRYDPLLGWSHEPGARDTYVGPRPWPVEFRTPVEINSLGLRGPEATPLPPDGVRVLVLGDSMVAAFEVPYEQTFVALVEKRLRIRLGVPVQVLNAGVRGYGTDQSYLYYKERGRLLMPDVVVFVHSLNDVRNNMTLHRMRRPFGKPAFGIDPDGLGLRGSPVPPYPLCSAWALDARYEPIRLDSRLERGACWVQTRLSDRSALFTFFALRLQRNPRLLRFLYGLGSPEEGVENLRAREAGFLPLSVPGSPAPRDFDATRARTAAAYVLTSEILRALGREVRDSGAYFLLVMRDEEFERLDAPRLRAEGIVPRQIYVPGGGPETDRQIRFENDSHFNARGHYYLASSLTDPIAGLLEMRLRTRPESARGPAAQPGER